MQKLLMCLAYALPFLVAGTTQANDITPAEAPAVAKEAFVDGFAFVENYRSVYRQAVGSSDPDYNAPFNRIGHSRTVATPADKQFAYALIRTQLFNATDLEKNFLINWVVSSHKKSVLKNHVTVHEIIQFTRNSKGQAQIFGATFSAAKKITSAMEKLVDHFVGDDRT
jgi:hypothetical protein